MILLPRPLAAIALGEEIPDAPFAILGLSDDLATVLGVNAKGILVWRGRITDVQVVDDSILRLLDAARVMLAGDQDRDRDRPTIGSSREVPA